ncbi:MAG: hypothetical protein WDN04_17675 [Rhodospirillales bacterium]
MQADLQRGISQLSEEIRNYPRPIARCDEQLAGLIEQRALLLAELGRAQEQEHGRCSPTATWINDGGFNAA